MRYLHDIFTIANSGVTSTPPLDGTFLTALSAQAIFSDVAAAGLLHIEVSNDGANPTHWIDIPLTNTTQGASQTVVGGAATMLPRTDMSYQWVRVTFNSTGGAGTITIAIKTVGF